jgi:hypothetical protein
MLLCIQSGREPGQSLVRVADVLFFLRDSLTYSDPSWATEFTRLVAALESAGTEAALLRQRMGTRYDDWVSQTLDELNLLVLRHPSVGTDTISRGPTG